MGWTPEPILNYAAYADQKYLSLYAGARWQMADKYMLVAETAGPCKPAGMAARAAQLALIEEDPNAAFAPFLAPEPDATVVGPGIAGLDLADWRYMPGKTIMFGLGAASKSDMEKIEAGHGYLAPAGDARGRDLYMRLLSDLGIKCETWYFDSNVSYHQDCIMLNVVEGVIGLPDDGKNGMWSDLPNCIKDWEILPLPLEDIKKGRRQLDLPGRWSNVHGLVLHQDHGYALEERIRADSRPLPDLLADLQQRYRLQRHQYLAGERLTPGYPDSTPK